MRPLSLSVRFHQDARWTFLIHVSTHMGSQASGSCTFVASTVNQFFKLRMWSLNIRENCQHIVIFASFWLTLFYFDLKTINSHWFQSWDQRREIQLNKISSCKYFHICFYLKGNSISFRTRNLLIMSLQSVKHQASSPHVNSVRLQQQQQQIQKQKAGFVSRAPVAWCFPSPPNAARYEEKLN